MIWYILLYILSFLLLLAAIFVFSPWIFRVYFLYNNNDVDFNANVSFIHPFFLQATYLDQKFSIRIFGKTFVSKQDDTVPEKTEPITESKIPKDVTIKRAKVGKPIANKKADTPKETSDNGEHTTAHARQSSEKSSEKKENAETSIKDEKEKNKAPSKKKLWNIDAIFNRLKKNPIVFFISDKNLKIRVWKWLKKIGKKFLRTVHIRRFKIDVTYGTDDPSTTGKIYGYIEGVRHALCMTNTPIDFHYQPSFTDESRIINCNLAASISFYTLLRPAMTAVLSFPYFTFFTTWLRFRQTRRQDKHAKHS